MTAYERPVAAKLVVELENGERWDAAPEDFERFNLVRRHDAYMTFDSKLSTLLHEAGLIRKDITDAALNPLRYLVELSVVSPKLLDDCADELAETWAEIVEIERHLQSARLNGGNESGDDG